MANTERIRIAGIACTIGGGLWVLNLMLGMVADDWMHGSAIVFRQWEAVFVILQVLLLVGVLGLLWSGATGGRMLGRIGLGITLLGRTAFVLGEVHSFAKGNDDSPLVAAGALITAVGMVGVGLAVLRARRWDGWRRPLPLLTGTYPFVAMFPVLAATGNPPAATIMLWGIPWLLLGLALYREAGQQRVHWRRVAAAG